MTRLFTVDIIGNKIGVVNRHESLSNDLFRYVMAIPAVRLNESFVCLFFCEKVAHKTGVIIDAKVFVSFEMAVARAA